MQPLPPSPEQPSPEQPSPEQPPQTQLVLILGSTTYNPLPQPPTSWLWRCHACHSVYRLACTRRCLLCSHKLCTPRGERQRPACRTEFDYPGWAGWGAWRRRQQLGRRQRTALFAAREQDCSVHCDYPSQCHHVRQQLAVRTWKRRMAVPYGGASVPANTHTNRQAQPVDDNSGMSTLTRVSSHSEEELGLGSDTSTTESDLVIVDANADDEWEAWW